ncbi:hypothetical protein GWK47_049418 [Chionoecetes opilio]|uniref:Uncharacterized protein n=1 Tax=Chionoecetes opilio TaxID=41210 RepID=A0A8J5CRP9_CHIOP|nr:hypothetical protein GWK47_049418 [Chionoecetes opilio]
MTSQRQTLPLGASLRQPSLSGSSKPNQLSLWRYSEILLLAPGVSPSRRIIQTASVQEGGEGCAGVAFTPYLRHLTYAFLLDLAPGYGSIVTDRDARDALGRGHENGLSRKEATYSNGKGIPREYE